VSTEKEAFRKALIECSDIMHRASLAFGRLDNRHGDLTALARIYKAIALEQEPQAADLERTKEIRR